MGTCTSTGENFSAVPAEADWIAEIYAARSDKASSRPPRTTWWRPTNHTTPSNLNPRASSIDTPPQLIPGKFVDHSISERGDLHRGERAVRGWGDFGGEMGLCALDAPGL